MTYKQFYKELLYSILNSNIPHKTEYIKHCKTQIKKYNKKGK